jgi:hypothetical protein
MLNDMVVGFFWAFKGKKGTTIFGYLMDVKKIFQELCRRF